MRNWTFALALALAGCGGKTAVEAEKKVTETGIDPKKDPFGVIGAIGQMAKDAGDLQKEMEKMTPVEPLHFSKLIAALPAIPSGWTADDAKGESSQLGEMKTSQSSRTYRKDGGPGEARITISDWAFNRAIYLPFMMQAKFSQESTEGYSKGIKVGADPGREEYKTKERDGSRTVLVHKRYSVTVNIQDMDAAAFDEWWGRIKVASLPAQ